jgi:hypothetical protein
MVAPAFAEMRREIAGRIGLGRRRPADAAPSVAQTTAESPDDAVKATDNVAVATPASPAKPSKSARPASPKAASARKKGTATPKSTPKSKVPAAEASVAAPAEAAKPDARMAEKKEAKPRKAKPAAEKTVPSAETAAPVAPAGSDIPSATAGEVKPKKAPTKWPPRSAAKSTDAKTAFAEPVEAPAPAPATDLAGEVPAKATPKRRGKLGLFGKGQRADEAASAEKEAIAAEPAADEVKSAKPAKVTKPKRMARSPKSSDDKAD